MVQPIHVHLVETKHVMRYLKGILDYGLTYIVHSEFRLCGYNDSDWDGSDEYIKSTSRCCFSLGPGVISRLSINKTSVATCLACIKAVWIHKLLTGLFDIEMDATDIYCDNQSCIKLRENLMFHDKSKGIEIKCH